MNWEVHFFRSHSILFESRTICTHSESLVHTVERSLWCFIHSRLWLEDLEFWLFGLFNRIFDLNTSSCAPEEGCQVESGWGDMMHLQAFFVARTWIHIPLLHEMWRETLNPHIGMVTSSLNVFFCISMTFILLPCCFGEPLGDVMLWMRICGNYRYLTMRYDYPPKRAILFTAFPLLSENFQSYDKTCCLFIPNYIFAYFAAFIEHFWRAWAPGAIAEHCLSLCNR